MMYLAILRKHDNITNRDTTTHLGLYKDVNRAIDKIDRLSKTIAEQQGVVRNKNSDSCFEVVIGSLELRYWILEMEVL